MNILACVPSKGRPYNITKQTMAWLPKVGIPFKVFVEPHEAIHYRQTVGKGNIVILPNSNMGIGFAVKFYSQYAIENGFDLIFRFDDDITSIKSDMVDSDNTEDVVRYILSDCLPEFDNDATGAIRFIGYRYYIFEKINENRRFTHRNDELWGTSIIRPQLSFLINPRLQTFDDTYLSLKIWDQGKNIYTYGRAGLNVKMDTNEGGIQCFDRCKISLEAFKIIKDEYPLVEQRPNTNNRIDLIVSSYGHKEVLH